jgi:Family of unknown function (DUF5958)
MSLEEEIAIYRFGQGVYPADELLRQFTQLVETDKEMQLFALHSLIEKVKPIDVDVDQAIAASGLDPGDSACVALKTYRWHVGTMYSLQNDIDHIYTLQLHLFKQAYQRQLALEKDNSTNWRYTDLSQDETVQDLLVNHQSLAEEIYANPGFRSEFMSLVKLWHNAKTPSVSKSPEIASESQTKANFMSYDDMVTNWVNQFANKNIQAALLLQRALRKGLAVRYKLDVGDSLRLLVEVLKRHMVETYGPGPSQSDHEPV